MVRTREGLRRYTGRGVSDAAVSAGKAEPTDESAAHNLETNLLFRLLRGPRQCSKRRSSCLGTPSILGQRAVCQPIPT